MVNILKASEGSSDPSEIRKRLKADHNIEVEENEIARLLNEVERRAG